MPLAVCRVTNQMTVIIEVDMERIVRNKEQQLAPEIRSILIGGTNATTPQNAIQNLEGIHIDQVGAANGIVPLEADSKILLSYFPPVSGGAKLALNGPALIYIGDVDIPYQITNYNAKSSYAVSVDKGTFTRDNDIIFFTPISAGGNHVITINEINHTISVIPPYTHDPVIVYPANDSIDRPLMSGFYSTIQVYGVTGPMFDNIHWQIATDANFSNILFDEILTDNSGQNWTVSGLPVASELYVRVKYRVIQLNSFTGWSNVVHFTTVTVSIPSALYQIIPSEQNVMSIGSSAVLNKEANLLIMNDSRQIGGLHIYEKNQTGNFVLAMHLPIPPISDIIGHSDAGLTTSIAGDTILISQDSSHIYFIVYISPSYEAVQFGGLSTKIVSYHKTIQNDNTTWVLEQVITPDLSASPLLTNPITSTVIDLSNPLISISDDGSMLGISYYFTSYYTTASFIVIFQKDQNDIYQQHQIIADPYIFNNGGQDGAGFGRYFEISSDGSYIVIFAYHSYSIDTNYQRGSIYVYEKDVNGVYNLTYTYQSSGPYDQISYALALSKYTNMFVIGQTASDSNYEVVRIFEKVNGVWSNTDTIAPSYFANYNGDLAGAIECLNVSYNGDLIFITSPDSSTPVSLVNNQSGSFDMSGYVLVYKKTDTGWVQCALLTHDDPSRQYEQLGLDISLSLNNNVAVIASGYDVGDGSYGAVMLYK